MHQLIATLFSLLIALCHHTSLTARPVEAAELPGTVIITPDPDHTERVLPDRYHFAHTNSESGYAGYTCLSCRRMEALTIER